MQTVQNSTKLSAVLELMEKVDSHQQMLRTWGDVIRSPETQERERTKRRYRVQPIAALLGRLPESLIDDLLPKLQAEIRKADTDLRYEAAAYGIELPPESRFLEGTALMTDATVEDQKKLPSMGMKA